MGGRKQSVPPGQARLKGNMRSWDRALRPCAQFLVSAPRALLLVPLVVFPETGRGWEWEKEELVAQ